MDYYVWHKQSLKHFPIEIYMISELVPGSEAKKVKEYESQLTINRLKKSIRASVRSPAPIRAPPAMPWRDVGQITPHAMPGRDIVQARQNNWRVVKPPVVQRQPRVVAALHYGPLSSIRAT